MKQIVTPLLLLIFVGLFAACNEKEFDIQDTKPIASVSCLPETPSLFYQIGSEEPQVLLYNADEALRMGICMLIWQSELTSGEITVGSTLQTSTSDLQNAQTQTWQIQQTSELVTHIITQLRLGKKISWKYDSGSGIYTANVRI